MRRIILRTADHHLVIAFRCPMIDMFIAGPAKSPPDVLFWGSRVFQFATMTDEQLTYCEAFSFALVEGASAQRLTDEELKALPECEPVVIFNG